jgi:hypothetical protein
MPKTRRTKQNRSPGRPYRNAVAHVVVQGDAVQTSGIRGRTVVSRVTDESGKRLSSVRLTENVVQKPAVATAKPIYAGRQYTGVARSRSYPYAGVKRGGPAPDVGLPVLTAGLLAKAVKAVKRVVVREAAE